MACGPAPPVVAILVAPFSYQWFAPIYKRATFWRLRALTFFTSPSRISCKRGPGGHASERFPLRDVCPHTLEETAMRRTLWHAISHWPATPAAKWLISSKEAG